MCRVVSYRAVPCHHITYHVSCRIVPCRAVSSHHITYHVSCRVVSYRAVPCRIIYITARHITSCDITHYKWAIWYFPVPEVRRCVSINRNEPRIFQKMTMPFQTLLLMTICQHSTIPWMRNINNISTKALRRSSHWGLWRHSSKIS